MALVPFIAFMTALLSVILYYGGLGFLSIIPFLITALFSLTGLIVGVKERPYSSRIASAMAALLGATPLIAPVVQDIRYAQLEAARAREMAPNYEKMAEIEEELTPEIMDYRQRHGIYPEFMGDKMLPYVDDNGALTDRPRWSEMEAPPDPFDASKPLRWVAIRDTGVLLVSVGQDGEPQMPLPGVAMDGPPMHPFAPLASVGADPRERRFDATGSPLGIGDLYIWVGEEDYEEAFFDLFTAWDNVHDESPYTPKEKRREEDTPQSTLDSQAAQQFMKEGRWLAVLAAASRGANERHRYPAQWTPDDTLLDYIRGRAFYELGAFRHAADALLVYISSQPNDATAHFYAAAALYYGGNQQGARLHLTAAQQIDPNNPVAGQADAILPQLDRNQRPGFPVPAIVESASQESGDAIY